MASEPRNTFKQVSMDDARNIARSTSAYDADGLLFLENVHGVDFTNKTLQLGFLLVCVCTGGAATARLNGKVVRQEPGQMLVAFGEQIIDECRPSDDFEGQIALISQEYALESFTGLRYLWPFLLYIYRNPVIRLTEEEQSLLFGNFRAIVRRLEMPGHRYRRDCVVSLLRVFSLDICRILDERQCGRGNEAPSRSYNIFDDFISLAQKNVRVHRDVAWYGEQLCISPKYLSEAVKQVSGKTAGQWLSTFVANEIRLMLRNTTLSIKEITQEMNFPNQSFMGKYFKNLTGMSPAAYRKGQ